MQTFRVVPRVFYFETFKEFHEEFKLGQRDLLVTSQRLYNAYVKVLRIDLDVILKDRHGKGEPSDEMIDSMAKEMKSCGYDRIIAFGGGSILDISKILALKIPEKSADIFTGDVPPEKKTQLIAIPTTCGTGSEVTNVAIAELKSLKTKKGVAVEETYADTAVLIPESLYGLPDYVFATSSIDALVHAVESYLSPRATPFTEMYSLKAVEMILEGYKKILAKGNTPEARAPFLKDFLLAATYAGIAFGNAGCAAVHALSYSIGGAFHVPHGEANYQFFTEVFKMYMRKEPEGKITKLNRLLADILACELPVVYDALDELLGQFIMKKSLREYGMEEFQIEDFTELTVANQQRLLKNNYVFLSNGEIREIFARLY